LGGGDREEKARQQDREDKNAFHGRKSGVEVAPSKPGGVHVKIHRGPI
jgi:hypothetical protein